MYTREFTPQAQGFEFFTEAPSKMDGSPVHGYHAAKIGFSMEMLLAKPPTVVQHIQWIGYSDNAEMNKSREESNLLPRAFNVRELAARQMEYCLAKTDDGVCLLSLVCNAKKGSHALRDMDADRLWYVYEGSAWCYTDLGIFAVTAGEFVYIPRHIFAKFVGNIRMIGLASKRGLNLPIRRPYDNTDTPFNEFAITLPNPYPPHGNHIDTMARQVGDRVFVKRNNEWSRVRYAYTPLLCIAWKGVPYPFAIHASKLNLSYVQSIHPDPSNFVVFSAPDASAVVSVLGSRFVHSLPYHHLNMWDEFLFYAKEYDARKGSGGGVGDSGTATLHPQGIWHGPQMAAFENWKRPESPKDIPWVDDLAIMFETRSPLQACKDAEPILIKGYEKSWLEGWEEYQEQKGQKAEY